MRNVTVKCSLASEGIVTPSPIHAEPGATETHSYYRIENVPDGVTDDQVAALVNQCGIWQRFVLDWSELRPGVIIMDISTATLAEATDKSEQWIRRIAPELEAAGLAYRNEDGRWKFRRPQAAEWVENRRDGRGAPSMIDKIIRACIDAADGPDGQYTGASVTGDFGEGPRTYEWRGRLGEYAPKWREMTDEERLVRWPKGQKDDPSTRPQFINWETGDWEYQD